METLAGTDVKTAIDEFADALVDAYCKGEDAAEELGEKLRLIHRRCFRLRLFGLKIDLIEFEFGDVYKRQVPVWGVNLSVPLCIVALVSRYPTN